MHAADAPRVSPNNPCPFLRAMAAHGPQEVMGKSGAEGRYLSLRDIRTLFVERRLPTRMMKKLR